MLDVKTIPFPHGFKSDSFLSADQLAELKAPLSTAPDCADLRSTLLSDSELRNFYESLQTLLNQNGVALVEGIDVAQPDRRDASHLCMAVLLGNPLPHHDGRLLWDITPINTPGQVGTISRSNGESPLHTDGSFMQSPPSYISNLSIQTAPSGGESTLVDGLALYEELNNSRADQDITAHLQGTFSFLNPKFPDRQEGVQASPLSLNPFNLRFRAGVLEGGLTTYPQSTQSQEAIRRFDEAIKKAPRWVRLINPGSVLVFNNRRYLHGRNPFSHPPHEPARHLQRIWISK